MRKFFAIVLTMVCAGVLMAADMDNPYKKANVGDWIAYKMSTKGQGMSMDMEQKQTVLKKSDTEVVLEMATSVMGQNQKQEVKIDLTQKYDPIKGAGQMPGGEYKVVAQGTEKISVGGKEYNTNWTEFEVSVKEPMPMTIKGKVWISTEVPMSGLVKMESDMGMVKVTMELKGCGTGGK